MSALRQCPHGFHHPMPSDTSYPHSCDGCWCEGERDRRLYGWAHESAPHADDCAYLQEDVVEPYGTRISPNAHCNCWKAGL